MKKILIIEDDLGISSSLQLYLENSGFTVELYATGEKALEKIEESDPHLIILDINLPVKSGIEITKEYRTYGKKPILMLTARSSELDKITGLEIGADDYMAKPFSPRELLARINTILRRYEPIGIKKTDRIMYFDLELFPNKKRVEKAGEELILTANEYEILEKLLKAEGKVVSRDTIMKKIIGYDNYVYDRTIDTHIKNLRKKLGTEHEYIVTVRGTGYRINK